MNEFNAKLIRPNGTGTWTYVNVPFQVKEVYGSKGQVKVKGTLNGIAYRGSLMPHGDGTHYMVVNQTLREAANAIMGTIVEVVMERDTEERVIRIPEDFLTSLEENAEASAFFRNLAYSYQKEYVVWIEAAKKPETRQARIAKSIENLNEGKKLK
ncbi:YdeI/OmpD-associated family protein [Cohnella luojiensis]|uniref:YdeI/OmpD-associated family protein n=1 Tax=Cohnella luojiensis TaxID=652876 RepID=UPI0014307D6B|nr:YdeI/OmpD-associated family protein [Cohnella luojiensis]